MDREQPVFSVIVAVLNAAATLPRCLDSVVWQTLPDWELIVMDGGSTDGTQTIIERYGPSIAHWESAPDHGISHAWNKALRRARGAWMLFLGADDRLADEHVLERAHAELGREGNPRVVYGSVTMLDRAGRVVATAGRTWEEAGRDFLRRNTIPHQGVFHHRSLFERHGEFDESFRVLGDYELLLRELKTERPRFLSDLTVVEMGAGGVSQQERNHYLATRELLRAQRKNGLTRMPYWLTPRYLRSTAFEILRRVFGWKFARRVADTYQKVTRTEQSRDL
jgi:glycosyltransferase involved in cell wall biosynthesis